MATHLDDEATVGDRIAYYRRRRGMTQEVFCGLVAWAHYLRRRDSDALDALNAARASAPEQLIFTRRVHAMLRGILRRERSSTRHDARALADFVGVA